MCKILSRIQEIASNEGITIGAMERAIGASKGVLSRAIANGTDIQAKWLISLIENYPQYSGDWLLTGNGNMRRPIPAVDIDTNKSRVGGDQVLVGDMIKIGDPEALCKEEETVCSLRREIDHLHALLKEKDARIASFEDQITNLKEQIQDKNELIAEYRATINDIKSQLR